MEKDCERASGDIALTPLSTAQREKIGVIPQGWQRRNKRVGRTGSKSEGDCTPNWLHSTF